MAFFCDRLPQSRLEEMQGLVRANGLRYSPELARAKGKPISRTCEDHENPSTTLLAASFAIDDV